MLSPRARAAAELALRQAWASGWQLPPELTVSQWAQEYRRLSKKSSSEYGHWDNGRTPYLVEIMDALSPSSPVRQVWLMKGAQLGGTEILNNWIGFIQHQAPGPTLLVLPDLVLARDFAVQRLQPLIEETPVLKACVTKVRKLSIEFPGGIMFLAGANSGPSLRSKPILNLPMDEVDEFPGDVGGTLNEQGQGDPITLALNRATTFSRSKVFGNSTPKLAGSSRIAKAYAGTDRRKYFVPCPHCGHMDWIQWSPGGYYGKDGLHHHIRYEVAELEDDEQLGLEHITAWLECSACKGRIEEHEKSRLLDRGEWRPTRRASGLIRGYHISSLYSPWKTWQVCVLEWLEAQQDVQKLTAFVNTVLGEPFEEIRTKLEPETLHERRETYVAEVPMGVGVLLCGVDVQDDRVEPLVIGLGAGEESWIIYHERIYGDPGQPELWKDLDEFLERTWRHESGRDLKLRCVAIDSGHHTDQVYRFCAARANRKIRAVKGSAYQGREIAGKPSKRNRYRLNVWPVGTDSAKDTIYSRLRIRTPGIPGYVHFPLEDWCDLDFFKQLLAEKLVWRWVRGRGSVRMYDNPTKARNEVLDCFVYALAALNSLGPTAIKQLGRVAARAKEPPPEPPAAAAPPAPTKPRNPFADPEAPKKKPPARRRLMRRPGNSWVNRWKP